LQKKIKKNQQKKNLSGRAPQPDFFLRPAENLWIFALLPAKFSIIIQNTAEKLHGQTQKGQNPAFPEYLRGNL
jgi:hypothetical protein